jgi:hypothetical protein
MRPGLIVSAIAAFAVFSVAPALAAGPRHHGHAGIHQHKAGTHHAHRHAYRHMRHHGRVHGRLAARPILTPFGASYYGAPYLGGSAMTVINPAEPANRTVTVNINTVQTVAGIRRPPEAAPLLYIIPANRREARQAQRASAAIRQLGSTDTTTARIIVVR